MYTINATVTDEIGLHARPANKFVKAAKGFPCSVLVKKQGEDEEFNAKSITAVLRMGAKNGAVIEIIADGEQEQLACEALKELLESDSSD